VNHLPMHFIQLPPALALPNVHYGEVGDPILRVLNFFLFIREKSILYDDYHNIYETNLLHPVECVKFKKKISLFLKRCQVRIDSKSLESFVKYRHL